MSVDGEVAGRLEEAVWYALDSEWSHKDIRDAVEQLIEQWERGAGDRPHDD